jgi:hypothetical protein
MGRMHSADIEKVLQKLPKTLEKLSLQNDFLDLNILPLFPQLTTLTTCIANATQSMKFLTQCPALTTLILRDHIDSLECLRGVKLQRLVISWEIGIIVDLSPLVDAQIDELDLSDCPKFTGLCEFPYIKTIKRYVE